MKSGRDGVLDVSPAVPEQVAGRSQRSMTRTRAVSRSTPQVADPPADADTLVRTGSAQEQQQRQERERRAEKARLLCAQRRARDRHFDARSGLFREPGWDMLLELYIAHHRGTPLRSTSVCYAGGVALTTGLRWLTRLEKDGLIETWSDEKDRRCRMIALAPKAVEMMTRYLSEL